MEIFLLSFLFGLSFIFRSFGFFSNHPFWVDEFSTAVQSQYVTKYGLSVFDSSNIYFEHHNIPTHFLVALLFRIFGQNEWVARLPSLVFGSFIPILVYILSKYTFDKRVAIVASLLTIFSYFEITWSRQARSYVLLQFITLLSLYFYFVIREGKPKNKKIYLGLLLIFLFFGFITQSFFYIFILSILLDQLLFHWKDLLHKNTKWWFYLTLVVFLVASIKINLFTTFYTYFKNGGFGANNLWYYHAFLWREYGIVTFLSLLGLLTALHKKNKFIYSLGIYIFLHLVFITFLFKPYSSRYILPIIPFLLMLMAYFIAEFSEVIFNTKKVFTRYLIPIVLTLFIILNGHKFVNRPKKFYSVNHDFRDIALIDYTHVYNLIKNKGDIEKRRTAIIETWSARTYWYLGIDYRPTYMFKWKGNIPSIIDNEGEKLVLGNNDLKLIENVTDLKRTISKFPKGFLFIDDSTLPKDVINYAEKNLKKELYLDHYALDENPYSIWPATLYSWGV